MFGMKGRWEVSETEIRYDTISASSGQSGSPIFIKKNGEYFAIGIHTNASPTNLFNYGVHLDDRVRKIINRLICETSHRPFSGMIFLNEDMKMLSNTELEGLKYIRFDGTKLTITGNEQVESKVGELLGLSEGPLSVLPEEIGGFYNLESLRLDNKQLS